MKVTVEDNVKDYILDKIIKMCLTFDDDTEVWLIDIQDIDMSLDKIDTSYINFTTIVHSVQLENYFSKKNYIKRIYTENTYADITDGVATEVKEDMIYEFPCHMQIRKLGINNSLDEVPNMYVELEGFVG